MAHNKQTPDENRSPSRLASCSAALHPSTRHLTALAIAPAAMASDVYEATTMTAKFSEVSRPTGVTLRVASSTLRVQVRFQHTSPTTLSLSSQPWHTGRSSKLNNPFNDVDDPSCGRNYEYMTLKIPSPLGATRVKADGEVVSGDGAIRAVANGPGHYISAGSSLSATRRVEGLPGCPPFAPRCRLRLRS